MQNLERITRMLLQPGKGILAADESTKTMNKRLASIEAEETSENREAFRELLFTTDGIEEYLSGVILFDSTMRTKTKEGTLLSDVLIAKGITPGIKVDLSTHPLQNFPGEVVTEGLDGLSARLSEYADLGAQFCKWRGVVTIDDEEGLPTDASIDANAFLMARYAALCQEAGMVPIVEPEVLFEGDHDIERAEDVTTHVLQATFDELVKYRVDLRGVILKSSMVLAGSQYEKQSTPEEVAEATIRTFKRAVPEAIAGVVFLSGGQIPVRATENLNAVAKLGKQSWMITFSYSRALEEPVLAVWKGDDKNVEPAQRALLKRLKLNALAQKGEYKSEMEKGA